MGARVSVTVKLPDGKSAIGATVQGTNHDAWLKSHKQWMATTDQNGKHVWENMDTGTMGDRYTFTADYTDNGGEHWQGSVSERIKTDLNFDIVLTRTGNGHGNGNKA